MTMSEMLWRRDPQKKSSFPPFTDMHTQECHQVPPNPCTIPAEMYHSPAHTAHAVIDDDEDATLMLRMAADDEDAGDADDDDADDDEKKNKDVYEGETAVADYLTPCILETSIDDSDNDDDYEDNDEMENNTAYAEETSDNRFTYTISML